MHFFTSADILGYDADMLSKYIDIPEYNGRVFDKTDIDLGQKSVMHIAQNTNESEYKDFLTDLEFNGFVYYTENQIGENLYATYLTEMQIVNVMYLANKGETRVTVDDRDEFDLPGLESDNIYKEVTDPSLTVIGIGTSGYPGGMGYVYKLSDGTFFIIDGGYTRGKNSKDHLVTSPQFLQPVYHQSEYP